MFSVFDINFADGVMAGGGINGAEIAIINSSDVVDRLAKDFKKYIYAGYDPNDVIDIVLSENHISEDDLTDYDIKKLNETVEEIYNRRYKW